MPQTRSILRPGEDSRQCSRLYFSRLKSRPYIEMTVSILKTIWIMRAPLPFCVVTPRLSPNDGSLVGRLTRGLITQIPSYPPSSPLFIYSIIEDSLHGRLRWPFHGHGRLSEAWAYDLQWLRRIYRCLVQIEISLWIPGRFPLSTCWHPGGSRCLSNR